MPNGTGSAEALAVEERSLRASQQLAFLVQVDRLKGVLRQTLLCDGSRRENSAEHSWHLALAAVVLAEHVDGAVDLARVVHMVLVHDLVEIDAGDTFAYDVAAHVGQAERERAGADRLFGTLPLEQGAEFRALWEEFEGQETPEARYATALDRLQPLLNNHHAHGGSWRAHGVTRDQVLGRMRPIEAALPALWPMVLEIIEQNCLLGHIRATPDAGSPTRGLSSSA
ncbi:MAG: HD domain-containing protein [Gemmatimonadota bacterium]|nr:HD domain-containing protein [Gemmatimonadota bacterium]